MGVGDARNRLMALAGDAGIVIGGRAGTISEVCLAWLHKRRPAVSIADTRLSGVRVEPRNTGEELRGPVVLAVAAAA